MQGFFPFPAGMGQRLRAKEPRAFAGLVGILLQDVAGFGLRFLQFFESWA